MSLYREKKGLQMTLEFVLEIIFGIIVVGILFYLGASVFGLFFGNASATQQKLEADGTLSRISEAVRPLEQGMKTDSIFLVAPKGWHLISAGKENTQRKVQKICEKRDCLCVCSTHYGVIIDCEKEAICRIVDKPFLMGKKYIDIAIANTPIEITNMDTFFEVEKTKKG